MNDRDREREYSPSSCLPDGDYRPFVAEYRRASDAAWSALAARSDVALSTIAYGPAASQTLDVAIPIAELHPPMVVFFHGGYWQELSKLDSRFAAADCVDRGWAFAAVDYTLAPDADLAGIVEESRASVGALIDHAPALGFDHGKVVVAGSSAGAHLAAMVALDTPEAVRAAVLVSGIFELEPLIGTSVNEALSLDMESARSNSPLLADLGAFPTSLLAFGENETAEFKAQSRVFADHLPTASVLEVPGRNHFDVIVDLATPGTVLGDAVAAHLEHHASL